MKNLFFYLFYFQLMVFSAQENTINIIDLDSTWTKEIFQFPISFAPELPYKGFEEARFPPKGWSDVHHPNFWSYVFAWKINLDTKYTKEQLEKDLTIYFNGLNRNKDFKTKTSFFILSEKENKSFFEGNVLIYDSFTTKKPLRLNVLVECNFNENDNSLLLFKFSPKEFTHNTWEMLKKIQLR